MTTECGGTLGVIDSLSAGYRFVGTKVWLLIIPAALDFFLWLAPRLSVAPILDQLAAFYADAASLSSLSTEMVDLSQTMADWLTALGEASNLWTALVSGVLLHVPSLMPAASASAGDVWSISNAAAALLIWLGLGLLGLWIGVVYLGLLARVLPIGSAPKPTTVGTFLRSTLRHWLRVVGFVALMAALLVGVYVPASIMIGLVTLIVPAFGIGLGTFLGFTILVVFLYLYFVTAALVLDDLTVRAAIARSLHLVRRSFWSVLGFSVLINVISVGVGLLLGSVAIYEPLGVIVAILLNAYVGVGLSMALLVFYRTRLLAEQGTTVMGDMAAG